MSVADGEALALRGWTGWRRRGIADHPVQIMQVLARKADGQPK